MLVQTDFTVCFFQVHAETLDSKIGYIQVFAFCEWHLMEVEQNSLWSSTEWIWLTSVYREFVVDNVRAALFWWRGARGQTNFIWKK